MSARSKVDISLVFDLVDQGPRTNIARDKDKMVAEAVWKERRRKRPQRANPARRIKDTQS
jgi:hypothetical protein